MSAIDWLQFGEDFKQKYEGTFCRYVSPITNKKEVFKIFQVSPKENSGPTITLFNNRAGELYLNYSTEAELDFTYPETTYFIHENKALLFRRAYQRQWKKGLCNSTAWISFPYDTIFPTVHPQIHEDMVVSLFTERPFLVTIDEAKTKLSKDFISYPLTNNLALGLSKVRDTHWLWFDHHALAEILENGHILVYMKEYIQEIKDYLKRTKSDGRFTI